MATEEKLTRIVKFHEVPSGGLEFDFSHNSGELNELLVDVLGEAPVYQANLNLRPVEDFVQLRGKISGHLHQVCSRCAENFSSDFSKKFVTAFYKSTEKIGNLSQAVDDLEGSFDLEFLEGNEIDLGEIVHEQMALEVPFQPLCSESCLGLCNRCGINLNQESCDCSTKTEINQVSPFAKLKVLRGD